MDQGLGFFESMSFSVRQARLIRSGVSSQLAEGRENRHQESTYRSRYAIQVCDLRGFNVSKLASGGIRTGLTMTSGLEQEQSSLMKRLAKVAVRSLYTLGLDSGEAIVSTYGERRYVLEKITPFSRLQEPKLLGLYHQHQANLHNALRMEKRNGIQLMMGMDPEFLLIDSYSMEVVPASDFLERAGEVGCDAVHMGGITSFPVAELRPEPSLQPRGLLVELMHAMSSASQMIRDRSLMWKAGGMPVPGLPLGGHLHFSGIVLTSDLLQVLDNYLTLPVMLLEDQSSLARRPHYGYLGDFRRQPHGGFEYRTLPSFLVSPLVTKGVVCLAYIIVRNYKKLMLRPLEQERIHSAFYEGMKQPIRDCIEPLFRDMRSLSDYSKYSKYIDPLLDHMTSGRSWDESRDIRPLWNVPVL
ncbi:putative amidoligase domain-containing protein [Paenibacillus sp. FA6]|uniref:putative amidoligase domain-containing protein n=1 Tax=Paenibacillus sp. FA6 TaxID=3413029 RepID=UPI003F654CDD